MVSHIWIKTILTGAQDADLFKELVGLPVEQLAALYLQAIKREVARDEMWRAAAKRKP